MERDVTEPFWEATNRRLNENARGHVWEVDWNGDVELFAYQEGKFHNGPRCVRCGYGFCHHCHVKPEKPCPDATLGQLVDDERDQIPLINRPRSRRKELV